MTIAVLDVETCGLPSNPRARVVELAAVALHPHRDYSEVDWFTSLVLPAGFDAVLDAPGLARSGIPVDAVLGARSEEDVRRSFLLWMAQHNVTEVFSYNRSFDETMLKRSGFTLPWAGCVMRLARAAMPPRKKDPSLAEACAHFSPGFAACDAGGAHRALPDAHTAGLLFAALRRNRV